MIPVYQTLFEQGEGNCFAACLASILELRLEDVPNFCAQHKMDWLKATNLWLAERSLEYILYFDTTEKCQEYHIMSGLADGEYHHSVVGYAGELVHDPHPGGGGLDIVDYHGFLIPI